MVKQYCDLCGDLTDKLYKKNLLVSFKGDYQNRKHFEICDSCKSKLKKLLCQAEVNFVESSETVIKNGIDYGEFRQVGSYEQGGKQCPKCGYCNNAYTFNGECQSCGYGKKQ